MVKYLLNKKNKGFSLIELLLVFVLIVGMTVRVLQQIKKKKPSAHNLMLQIAEVTQKIFLQSILEGKSYRVHLFFSEDNLLTHIGYNIYNKNIIDKKNDDFSNKKILSHPFLIYNCIINGHDEMAIKSKEIWFDFYPEGFCQEVKFTIAEKPSDIKYNYTLNPFNGNIED